MLIFAAAAGHLKYLGLYCLYNEKIIAFAGLTTRSDYLLNAVTYVTMA